MPSIRRDFSFAFVGQAVNIIVGVLRALLIPMMFGSDLTSFAQWQGYLLYVGYLSLGFLGFNDGLYVRSTAESFTKQGGRGLRSSLAVNSAFLVVEAALLIGVALLTGFASGNTLLWVAVLANLPLAGIYGATGYMLQLSGRIDKSAVLIITEKGLFLLSVIVVFAVTRSLSFPALIVADVSAKFIAMCLGFVYCRSFLWARALNLREGLREFGANISVGVKIMLGSYFALLFTGAVRIFVENTRDSRTFALFAFAFSLTNIVVLAAQALGMVIYPHLMGSDKERLADGFRDVSSLLRHLFPLVLLLYYPLSVFVKLVLPQYSGSVGFLALLLPVSGLQVTISVLNNSFYKLLREERRMLTDNLVSLSLIVACCLILRANLTWVLIAQICVMTLRVFLTQAHFDRRLGVATSRGVLYYVGWSALFLAQTMTGSWQLGIAVGIGLVLHIWRARSDFVRMFKTYWGRR